MLRCNAACRMQRAAHNRHMMQQTTFNMRCATGNMQQKENTPQTTCTIRQTTCKMQSAAHYIVQHTLCNVRHTTITRLWQLLPPPNLHRTPFIMCPTTSQTPNPFCEQADTCTHTHASLNHSLAHSHTLTHSLSFPTLLPSVGPSGSPTLSHTGALISRCCILHVGLSWSLIADSLWAASGTLLLGSYLCATVIPREEAYMRAHFGAAYDEYCSRVRRWLPCA